MKMRKRYTVVVTVGTARLVELVCTGFQCGINSGVQERRDADRSTAIGNLVGTYKKRISSMSKLRNTPMAVVLGTGVMGCTPIGPSTTATIAMTFPCQPRGWQAQ